MGHEDALQQWDDTKSRIEEKKKEQTGSRGPPEICTQLGLHIYLGGTSQSSQLRLESRESHGNPLVRIPIIVS